jgi:hypothetical protein
MIDCEPYTYSGCANLCEVVPVDQDRGYLGMMSSLRVLSGGASDWSRDGSHMCSWSGAKSSIKRRESVARIADGKERTLRL